MVSIVSAFISLLAILFFAGFSSYQAISYLLDPVDWEGRDLGFWNHVAVFSILALQIADATLVVYSLYYVVKNIHGIHSLCVHRLYVFVLIWTL
jgi:hypothetical protein